MRPTIQLLEVCILSILVYLLTFGFLIKKPLTIGYVNVIYGIKFGYAKTINQPKLAILAASNGFFSFRCETMEPILNRPCVNAAIGEGLGFQFVIDKIKTILEPGDVVLMPLEYGFYTQDQAEIESGAANAYMAAYDKKQLLTLEPLHMIRSIFHFNYKFLLSGAVEMILNKAGVSRRFNANTTTKQGDMKNHTIEKGKVYKEFLLKEKQQGPIEGKEFFGKKYLSQIILEKFLSYSKANDIRIIGTLPTTFDDHPTSELVIKRISDIYENMGQQFLVLPNKSQYSRDCFYDTSYHLNEPCQIKHSKLVAKFLKPLL